MSCSPRTIKLIEWHFAYSSSKPSCRITLPDREDLYGLGELLQTLSFGEYFHYSVDRIWMFVYRRELRMGYYHDHAAIKNFLGGTYECHHHQTHHHAFYH